MSTFGFKFDQVPLTTQIDYAGGSNPIYIGLTNPGNDLTAAAWQIKKLTYDSNDNVVSVTYANGGSKTNIWNNRTSLTYN